MSRMATAGVLVLIAASSAARAAPEDATADAPITLNLPETVQLHILTKYVAERLGLNIIYDGKVGSHSLTMLVKGRLTKGDLLPLFRTVLKFRGLSLVPTDTPGVHKIVELKDAGRAGDPFRREAPPAADGQAPVTQVVVLHRLRVDRAKQLIQPFLSSNQAGVVPVPDHSILLITDYAANVSRAMALLTLLEEERFKQAFRTYAVKHQDVTAFAKRMSQITNQKLPTMDIGPPGAPGTRVSITADVQSGSLLIVGPEAGVAVAMELAEAFDTEDRYTSAIRALLNVEAARAERLVTELFPSHVKRVAASGQKAVTVDKEGNALILRGDRAFHREVAAFLDELDVPLPAPETTGRMRTIKLYNTKIADVFETLKAIVSQGLATTETPRVTKPSDAGTRESGRTVRRSVTDERGFQLPPPRPFGRTPGERAPVGVLHYAGEGIRLIGSEPNNSILIAASPETVQEVSAIIRMLDKRRPQVLIEVILLSIDDSKSLNLGTEWSTKSRDVESALEFKTDATISAEEAEGTVEAKVSGLESLVFTAFGLSTIDPLTGRITPTSTPGLNAVVISPGDVQAVIKALQTYASARIVTAPRILVNDNATGILESVQEQPYTTFYATQEVATTTFGGFAEAGTRLEVVPTISEGDHLQLSFSISVGNFSGESPGSGVPPPRLTKTLSSVVTVPDGHTVIVGGLKDEDERQGDSGVPFLSRIPILGYLVKSETRNRTARTVYAFIRPVILRDDRFEDLRYLSDDDLAAAGMPSDLPASEPQWMDTVQK